MVRAGERRWAEEVCDGGGAQMKKMAFTHISQLKWDIFNWGPEARKNTLLFLISISILDSNQLKQPDNWMCAQTEFICRTPACCQRPAYLFVSLRQLGSQHCNLNTGVYFSCLFLDIKVVFSSFTSQYDENIHLQSKEMLDKRYNHYEI